VICRFKASGFVQAILEYRPRNTLRKTASLANSHIHRGRNALIMAIGKTDSICVSFQGQINFGMELP